MADIDLVIKIPDYTVKHLVNGGNIGASLMIENAIKNGKLLPEGATNGDVIKTMFPNLEGRQKAFAIEVNVSKNKIGECSVEWWDAPYKAESEVAE